MVHRNPLIVVLPGIGGSVLARPGDLDEVVWDAGVGDLGDFVAHPDGMSVSEARRLKPIGLTRSTKLLGFTIVPGYEQLLDQLRSFGTVDERGDPCRPVPGADVVAVPYDFRHSISQAATRLDAVVRAHLGDASEAERAGRVVVVAHSMGGLVARYWLGPLGRWRWCGALVTLGTPHRGAPKALDWLVNGVRLLGVQLSRPTKLLRDWPSVTELLPRYKAVRDTTRDGRSCYPHELPIPELGGATAAYELHCEIEDAWRDMPRRGPRMLACIGWSHPTPDAAFWDGQSLVVTKTAPGWIDLAGWEKDFGDGTVPAVSALPIELSAEVRSPVRVRDRHAPMACSSWGAGLVAGYLGQRPLESVRGEENGDHLPAIGLDLDELYAAGESIPVEVRLREVEAELANQAVWVTLRPTGNETAPAVDLRLDWDGSHRRFVGELPGQSEGLYDVRVSAPEVPDAGDLAAVDSVAVLADG